MIPAGEELTRAAWAQAWQVTVLIVMVAVLARLFARNRPHLAHALWLIVLLKCITPPVFSSTAGVFCWVRCDSTEQSAEAVGPAGPLVAKRTEPLLPEPIAVSRIAGRVGAESGASDGDFAPEGAKPDEVRGPIHREIEVRPAERTGRERITAVLLAGWVLGTLMVLGIMAVRWAGLMRRLRRAGLVRDRSLDGLTASLSRRLKLRRPARLLVTPGRVGPAVIGLFRPTVLLPEVVVRGKTAADLEPIIAHELIHVRRGDLWVGMLQLAAEAVWWFHPLVWWAGRLVAREAERCCDEAVVAELRCGPARYARCLYDVLEQKRVLKPVYAFPGVRPVEVTSRRLERIMRLGQGSHKRSPWWCWTVMLVAAAVTLPGAALVVRANEEDASVEAARPPLPAGEAIEGDDSANSRSSRAESPSGSREGMISCVYGAGDILDAMGSELFMDESRAREVLKRLAALAGSRPGSGGPTSTIAWSGNTLVVRETSAGHERIAATLERLREHGFESIVIEAVFLTGSQESIDAVGANWTGVLPEASAIMEPLEFLDAVLDPGKNVLSDERTTQSNRAQMVIQRDLPVMFEILDDKKAAEVRDRLKGDLRASILSAPKVMVRNGQLASISVYSESPFVVGVKNGKPQIEPVPEGLFVRLRPLLQEKDSLRLDCEFVLSSIRNVETTFPPHDPTGKPMTLQMPELETARMNTSVVLPIGKTLLIGGLKRRNSDGDLQSMLVMLCPKVAVQKVAVPLRAASAEPAMDTRTYAVADLITLPGEVHFAPNGLVTSGTKPARSDADFDTLIELIKTTFAPETWSDAGGVGEIAKFETNLSLVVRQTQEVHAEIVDLLSQLRRLQATQIELDLELVHMSQEIVETIGIDAASGENGATLVPQEAQLLRTFAQESSAAGIRRLAHVALLNGRLARIGVSREAEHSSADAGTLLISAQMERSDGKTGALLRIAIDPKEAEDLSVDGHRVWVEDGRTLLFEVTDRLPVPWGVVMPLLGTARHASRVVREPGSDAENRRTFILVTPTIVEGRMEEELHVAGF